MRKRFTRSAFAPKSRRDGIFIERCSPQSQAPEERHLHRRNLHLPRNRAAQTFATCAVEKLSLLVTPDVRRGLIMPGHARATSIVTPRTRPSLHVCACVVEVPTCRDCSAAFDHSVSAIPCCPVPDHITAPAQCAFAITRAVFRVPRYQRQTVDNP